MGFLGGSLTMYNDWTEQLEYRIGKYIIGGKPGKNPAWLIGSIFYLGDKLLLSEKGDFDKEKAKAKIEEAINIAENYSLVFGLDVVFPSIESIDKILPFISEYDIPIFLDSPDPIIRAKSYLVAKELGINDKIIANGIFIDSPEEEINALRDGGIKTSVIMAFDPRNPLKSINPLERLRLLETVLLPLAEKAGVEQVLVDAIVIDPASIAFSAETIFETKKRFGYPSGCAPANALGPVSKSKTSIGEMYGVHGGVAVYLRIHGADYIMYGPISRIKYVAPAVAMADSLLGYSLRRKGEKISSNHPIKKMLRKVQKLFATSK